MGADTSLKNKAGLTPLHYIAIHGNPQLTIIIPAYLIDITTANTNMTMLHCASHSGNDDVVRYLLEHGALVCFSCFLAFHFFLTIHFFFLIFRKIHVIVMVIHLFIQLV